MKLDLKKYSLIKNRELLKHLKNAEVVESLEVLDEHGILDRGDTPDSEFFVIRLKDSNAFDALQAYADAARTDDEEFADGVEELAARAASHPNSRRPD